MGMTPTQYFESFVQENAFDCHQHPNCVRRAFNAAVSASHLADHAFHYGKRRGGGFASAFTSFGEYVEYLSEQTGGAFKDIRSIANAYKHLYTDTNPKKEVYSSISSAGAIVAVELVESDEEVVALAEDYEDAAAAVAFTRKNGSREQFLPALDTVVEYWRQVLYESA